MNFALGAHNYEVESTKYKVQSSKHSEKQRQLTPRQICACIRLNDFATILILMFPLWLKIVFTLVVCVILVVNWRNYGPRNFLWFSDIALLVTVPALWFENGLLASMMALSIVAADVAWNVDFFGGLMTGRSLFGLGKYMFDERIPWPVRLVSLFHIWFPALLLWMVYRLGYDERALLAQTALAWVVLPVSYLVVTEESENINWVRGPRGERQKSLPGWLYLALLMLALPLLIYLPTHLILKRLMPLMY